MIIYTQQRLITYLLKMKNNFFDTYFINLWFPSRHAHQNNAIYEQCPRIKIFALKNVNLCPVRARAWLIRVAHLRDSLTYLHNRIFWLPFHDSMNTYFSTHRPFKKNWGQFLLFYNVDLFNCIQFIQYRGTWTNACMNLARGRGVDQATTTLNKSYLVKVST